MATEEMRRMLQQLMGQEPVVNGKRVDFTDSSVCRQFLCGFCPYDLFTNTRLDMGKCDKIHSEQLRREYQEARQRKDYGYEADWLRSLERIAADNDHLIARQKARIEETQDKEVDLQVAETHRKIADAEERMKQLDAEIDELTAELKLEEVKAKNDEKEALAVQLKDLQDLLRTQEKSSTGGTQKLRVCEVCGAQLSALEIDERLADHFGGKMHVGVKMIRDKIAELRAQLGESGFSRRSSTRSRSPSRDRRRSSYDRSRSRDRYRGRSRSRDRYRDRYDDRDRYRDRYDDRRRDRYDDRDRDRDRYRDRYDDDRRR